MIERLSALLLLIAVAACTPRESVPLERFVGCWTNATGSSHEIWAYDGPDRLIGFGVTYKDAGLRSYEVLSLENSSSGSVFAAHPSRQTRGEFKLVSTSATGVRFENPEHDYPQWIEYHWQESALVAEIGTLDSDQSTVFRKQRCLTETAQTN
jgi:hypothetical protein